MTTSAPGAHRTHHPEPVDGCLGCKILGLVIAPSATPSRGEGQQVAIDNARDAALHKDRDAYKRLRADGLQPNSVDGSAALEGRLQDQIELDYKIPIPAKELPRVKEIQAQVAMQQAAGGNING